MPENSSWIDSWKDNRTPWDYQEANEQLDKALDSLIEKYFPQINQSQSHFSALVPLCGDSAALKTLSENGFKVEGIEIAELAFQRFKKRFFPDAAPKTLSDGPGYQLSEITFRLEDFFTYQAKNPFDLIYDRAALVAVEPQMREKYAEKLISHLDSKGILFLIAYEYSTPEGKIIGPPYSVSKDETLTLFSRLKLKAQDTIKRQVKGGRLEAEGVDLIHSHAFIFQAG